ncbi:hypothetical protein [Hymenobacter sp. AT01-02]|uniref:hypothetical protein n=1 Tax=Hymenobacter sp. AT01-02 TaxID=1571877 RepID=UPI0005F185F6|nr:hypothetical protein [Hymenobacter sp. AT01-02]
MKRAFSFFVAAGLLATLPACDYNNTPGKDPQASQDFTEAPKARSTETNLDSISGGDEAYTPIGKGSAADQKTSNQAGLDGSPGSPNSPNNTLPEQNQEARGTSREQ